MADTVNDNSPTEINPRPIRVVQTMGDITFTDWIWFGAFAFIVFPIILWCPVPAVIGAGIPTYAVRAAIASPFIIIGCLLAFAQSKTNGKFRWRFWRGIKFMFSRKFFSPLELKQIYEIKEIKDNHLHYNSLLNEGVISVYRIEGFDPTLLSNSQLSSIVNDLGQFFSVNLRFKIVATRINYVIPPKDIPLKTDHYGINFARNRYLDRIDQLNKNVSLKQQAYFLIIEGPSIAKNEDNSNLITSPLTDAHLSVRPAVAEEVAQVFNEIWGDGFNFADPAHSKVAAIAFDKKIIKFTKNDGKHKYMSILSYNSIPEVATLGWLGHIFNTDHFSLIMDVSPMSPQDASKYISKLDTATESLMQTNWFRKRAADQERKRIRHVRELTSAVNNEMVEGNIGLKEVQFYLIFSDDTRRGLQKRVDEFKRQLSAFNDGWVLFDCTYLQKDAIFNTRLHDIPVLQYKSGVSSTKNNYYAGHEKKHQMHSSINKLTLTNAIDHKILTTSLGLSYPFYSRASIADASSWFRGFQLDQASGDLSPFFASYWKKNELYNSFNRFYQGRNGSGKSYTADLDVVCDRLDDKFIISVDPKPERVFLTKNLGGENLLIGSTEKGASFINIFDILVVPNSDSERQNPLTSQYQANLTSISILLSLDVNNPNDKVVLSCFNDVQVHVYEKIKKITQKTNFTKLSPHHFPLMKDFYEIAQKFYRSEKNPETKSSYNKLIILMKEHAVGISAPLFNNYTNVDWSKNRMWNLIVRDIALNFGNKNILACWTINIIRVASAFLYANQKVALYIDELHLIHNINGVLQRLDEFARVDRSFNGALCLINQNFNSIRGDSDPKKKEYYESIFTMSQYNMFFTTGEEDVDFLVQMLEGSGEPLSQSERNFVTKAGMGKALMVMNAYDRYRIQFDISFWRELWEEDLEQIYKDSIAAEEKATKPTYTKTKTVKKTKKTVKHVAKKSIKKPTTHKKKGK